MNKGILTALCLAVLLALPACCWKKCNDVCDISCEPCVESCVDKYPEKECETICVPVQPFRRVTCCKTVKCGPVEYPCECPEELMNGQAQDMNGYQKSTTSKKGKKRMKRANKGKY